MKLKIINKSKHPLPEYETSGSSGMDLRANLDNELIIEPFDRVLVPTGLFLEFEKGYEAQVRARSGLALKKGLGLPNGIGTIDSDYRGELKIILINMSKETVVIKDGERVAQLVFMKIEIPEIQEVEKINNTKRSDGGFGHTGL
ncbi:dUTP diphosphatase [Peptoniphilus rhinitidis]|uniref:dUTP diphosphatase n=1 Tax=Peptoniphilus rhinitidis TaxID=1175452 RepID=UPI00290D36F2|nr:dUTP diphosphatase [Peptoniphilus rhinitidis]MDU5595762.1 dUTP diphosphatase [Peptoniphilus rhinitidis]